MQMKKSYHTCCIYSEAEKINQMVDNGQKITYKTFLRHVSRSTLDMLFPIYSACRLKIENDYTVSFYKSQYEGKTCVYINHSAIDYVFI